MIKTIISDMGNVILSFDVSLFLKEIAEYSRLEKDEVMDIPILHSSLIESFSKGIITSKNYYDRMREIFKADIPFKKFKAIYCDIFSLNSSVLKTLSYRKGKNKLLLLSNTDVLHFSFIKQRFPEIFIFDDYILSYRVGCVKPEEKIFRTALERAEAQPEEIVFIDDRKENIRAAEKAGLKTIHFDSKKDLKAELEKYGVSF